MLIHSVPGGLLLRFYPACIPRARLPATLSLRATAGGSRKVWDWCAEPFRLQKTGITEALLLASAVALLVTGLAGFLPTAPSGFALGALVFFVLRLADMQRVGGAQAFPRERITLPFSSLRSDSVRDIVSRFSRLPCKSPACSVGFGVIL